MSSETVMINFPADRKKFFNSLLGLKFKQMSASIDPGDLVPGG